MVEGGFAAGETVHATRGRPSSGLRPPSPTPAARAKGKEVVVGAIIGAHGIRGEVKIRSFTEDQVAIADYGPLSAGETRTVEITAVRQVKDGLVCRLRGIGDRTQAEALKGLELKVARDRLPEEEPGSYYHGDLIGLAVLSRDGRTMGKVVGVRNYGAGDLIEFRRPGRRATDLVPFTDAFVPEVDVAGGRLIVDPPEGLLEE